MLNGDGDCKVRPICKSGSCCPLKIILHQTLILERGVGNNEVYVHGFHLFWLGEGLSKLWLLYCFALSFPNCVVVLKIVRSLKISNRVGREQNIWSVVGKEAWGKYQKSGAYATEGRKDWQCWVGGRMWWKGDMWKPQNYGHPSIPVKPKGFLGPCWW